jgi:hypothetical protein
MAVNATPDFDGQSIRVLTNDVSALQVAKVWLATARDVRVS